MNDTANDLDHFMSELQETVLREAEQRYGPTVIDHWMNPRHWGPLQRPDGYARFRGVCGDTMQIWLRIAVDRIEDVSFMTDGCGSSIACGSAIVELARGKTIEDAAMLDDVAVLEHLGGLPDEDRHCAILAATTFLRALDTYLRAHRDHKKNTGS